MKRGRSYQILLSNSIFKKGKEKIGGEQNPSSFNFCYTPIMNRFEGQDEFKACQCY